METDTATERHLVARAQAGDGRAFDELVAPLKPRIRSILRKLVGHPDDSDEILQDSLLKCWLSIAQFENRSGFSTWLTSIATRTAIDFLRKQKRWRPEAQIAYANLCSHSDELSSEVMTQFSSPDFSYEVREHISYCFSCVGRSLPPDEIAVLLLRDVFDMSSREASNTLGVSESVMRHRLSAARRMMQERYEGLCSLVSKQGVCYQCKGLRMVAPDGKKGEEPPDVATLAQRCKVVSGCKTERMSGLHDVFWRNTKTIELEGRGSTMPESDCGDESGA